MERSRRFLLYSDSRGVCLVRAADGHHRRRPRIACRRLTQSLESELFFSKCELVRTSQKFICILSTASRSAKKWRPAVKSKAKWINSSAPQIVEESTLGYYVDLHFVGI